MGKKQLTLQTFIDYDMRYLLESIDTDSNKNITKEIALVILTNIGVFNKDGNLSPKYYSNEEISNYKNLQKNK